MPMFKIRGMYFSGTGTTETVVKTIAKATAAAGNYIEEVNIDFTPKEARDEVYSFSADQVVIFGVPVIAGRVPNVLLKFLGTLESNQALAVPVVLYGNRNFDDALIELRNILEEQGFHTIAGGAFIGEHSFSRILAAGRPDNKDLDTARDFGKKIAHKLESLDRENPVNNPIQDLEPVEVEGQTPIRDYYKPQDRNGKHINILKVKPKLDESKCTKCGLCVKICPMGSIKEDAPGQVQGICIKCCGCEKKCPEGALYFDDPGYLYHKGELEYLYSNKRREPALFI